MKHFLNSSYFFELENPEIQHIISAFRHLKTTEEKIEGLYLKVRDGWRYGPYRIGLTKEHYKVSNILTKPDAHCIDKAILFITGLRALGIPARLRLDDKSKSLQPFID
jgi:transglutaminase-like putative cysteine protease